MLKPALVTAAYVLTDSYGHRALALERFGRDLASALDMRFPGLSLATPEPTHPAAHVYYNANGCYLTGTLHLDGHLAIQRFSIETPQQAEALFALIDGRADRDL